MIDIISSFDSEGRNVYKLKKGGIMSTVIWGMTPGVQVPSSHCYIKSKVTCQSDGHPLTLTVTVRKCFEKHVEDLTWSILQPTMQ